jgi:hypothetical protein
LELKREEVTEVQGEGTHFVLDTGWVSQSGKKKPQPEKPVRAFVKMVARGGIEPADFQYADLFPLQQ